MLAGIPYTTFPDFELGPLTIRTFGLLVGLGVLVGAWVAGRFNEGLGIERDDTYRLATRMVLAGLIGSRLTWVLSHLEEIDSPVDVVAVWEGGIQFSGGFVAAVLVGLPTFRTWTPALRWRILDGYAYGLTIGLALGRLGCYSVGEHFGRLSDFALATTYEGGSTQEDVLGDLPLEEGMTFHHTALYEFAHLLVLFGVMTLVVRYRRRHGREVLPGTLMGLFVVWYGVARFLTDALRVNDERVAGLTGAQWMSLVLVPVGLWVLFRVRHVVDGSPDDQVDPEDPADPTPSVSAGGGH